MERQEKKAAWEIKVNIAGLVIMFFSLIGGIKTTEFFWGNLGDTPYIFQVLFIGVPIFAPIWLTYKAINNYKDCCELNNYIYMLRREIELIQELKSAHEEGETHD